MSYPYPGRDPLDMHFNYEFRSGFLDPRMTEYRAHPAPDKSSDPLINVRNEVAYSLSNAEFNAKQVQESVDAVEKQRAEEREKHASEVSTLERRVAELEEALRTVQRLNPYDSSVKLVVKGVGVAV